MNTSTIAVALSIFTLAALTVCGIAIAVSVETDDLRERMTLLENRAPPRTVTETTETPAPPTVTVSIEISGDGNNTSVEVYGGEHD
jgi:hypothetical protein